MDEVVDSQASVLLSKISAKAPDDPHLGHNRNAIPCPVHELELNDE
jgi:hypothetical protein